MLKFSTTERNGELLQYDGYSYIRYSAKENKKGTINWRCQHSRDKFGCKATCSTSGDTITRYTKVAHTCPKKNDLCVALYDAKRKILKCISDAPTSCNTKNVFNTELIKTVNGLDLENGYDEIAPQLPVIF